MFFIIETVQTEAMQASLTACLNLYLKVYGSGQRSGGSLSLLIKAF